jgi:hypothetical protein
LYNTPCVYCVKKTLSDLTEVFFLFVVEPTIGHKTVALLQDMAVQPVAIDTERSTSISLEPTNITTTMFAPIPTPMVATVKAVTPRPCFVLPSMLGGGQRQQVLVTAKPLDPLHLNYHFVHNTVGE